MSSHDESLLERVIAGDGGLVGAPLRALLTAGEYGYASVVRRRNARYDRRGAAFQSSVPVISVGNITVGGTGKTPLVIELIRRFEGRGRSPAVVARGYKSEAGGSNDEQRLVQLRCPGAAYVANADRAAACETAVRDLGADVIVLDDGFQHRRVGRALDIVLLDATCPFGYDRLLPRGLLREPIQSLRRASVLIVSRCDQVGTAQLARITARLREVHGDAVVLRCRHRVTGLSTLAGRRVDEPIVGKRAVLFAAIGNPRSFQTTAAMLGADVVGHRWFPDHHRYSSADVRSLLSPSRFPPHDLFLTTEKDAVKLAQLRGLDHVPIVVVCVDIDFENDDGTILDSILGDTLAKTVPP